MAGRGAALCLVHIGAVDSCTLQRGCLLAFRHEAVLLGGAPIAPTLGDCIGKCVRPAQLEMHTHARRVRRLLWYMSAGAAFQLFSFLRACVSSALRSSARVPRARKAYDESLCSGQRAVDATRATCRNGGTELSLHATIETQYGSICLKMPRLSF